MANKKKLTAREYLKEMGVTYISEGLPIINERKLIKLLNGFASQFREKKPRTKVTAVHPDNDPLSDKNKG